MLTKLRASPTYATMRRANARTTRRLACLSTLAACAVAGLALAAAGNAPAASDPDLGVAANGNSSFAWVGTNGVNDIAQTRRRFANGTLEATQDLSAAGQNASFPQVAVAPDGTASFVWTRSNGSNTIIQTRSRAPDGTLSAIQNLSAAGQDAQAPQVAIDPAGNASFAWVRLDGSHNIVQARRRLANGTLEKAQSISGSGQNAFFPQVAVDPNGRASFVWQRFNGTNQIIQARRLLANGTFEATQNLSATGQDASSPQVAVDPDGNASFVWQRSLTIQARRRLANGTLEATQDLAAGQAAFSPQVALVQGGDATFVWTRSNGANFIVQARRRLFNGTLEATANLSAAGQDAQNPQVALARNGAATFAWRRSNGTNFIAQTRRRLANGTYTTQQNLSAPGEHASPVRLGLDQSDQDNATFAWQRAGVIQTRRRAASLGATVDLSN